MHRAVQLNLTGLKQVASSRGLLQCNAVGQSLWGCNVDQCSMVYTLLFGGWYGAAVHWFGEWCTGAGSGKQQCTSSSAPTTTSPPPWSHSCPLLPPCSIHLRCVIQATDVFHSAHCYSGSQLLLQLPLLQPWSHYCHSSLIFIHLGNPGHCFQGCGETQFSPQAMCKRTKQPNI